MKKFILVLFALISLAALSCRAVTSLPSFAIPTATQPAPTLIAPTPGAVALPSATVTVPAGVPVRGAANLGDRYYPQMGNGGYDALHYTIDLTVDVANNRIDGSSSLAAQTTQGLLSFNLDLHGLKVSAVTVNDTPATFSRKADELIIIPAQPLKDGEKFSVTVSYSGNPDPVEDAASPGFPVGWFADAGVYVVSEPNGAMSWYPVNNHPLDKALYTFRITAPKQFVVAANGLLKATVANGETTTYIWEITHPMASYLATLEIGKYKQVTSSGPNDLPINFYFPPDVSQDTRDSFSKTSEMISYYSQVFGPYPFESYGIIVLPTDLGYAEEDQTLSVFGQDSVDEITAAHELSHQWFGDSVSLKSWKDIWLNEGFATYAEALWVEHTQGKSARDKYMKGLYTRITDHNMPAPADPSVGKLFNDFVYFRGGWVLHALRLKVGDELFFKILHEYYARYQYGNASSEDFIAVAEQVSGQDLKEFFDGWLYSDQVPPMPEVTN